MNTALLWDNLVAYSFQIGLLVGLAAFVPALLRLQWPGAKLIYWQLLLAACLVLPLVRPLRQEVIASAGIAMSTTVTAARPHAPSPRPSLPRRDIALLVLAAGALIRIGWLASGFWKLRKYRLHSRPLRLHEGCPILLSDEVSSPVTFGWRRPVVLLPTRFPDLERRIQDAILCHELLHVERRDWLFTIAEEVIRAIFWFHPAIWWLLGEIQLAREQVVDSLAIERTDARDEYVDALLAIAGARTQTDLALAPLFLRKRHLKQRVISILKEVRMSKTKMISRLSVGLAMLVAACWIATGTFPLAAAPQISNDAPGVTVDLGGAALLHRAPVSYPEQARKRGVQGTVMVEATLDGNGNVSDAHVVSGPDELRKAALQSVLQWHFGAAASGSKRTVGIAFQLPAEAPQTGIVGGVPGGVVGGVTEGVIRGVISEAPVPSRVQPVNPEVLAASARMNADRQRELQDKMRQLVEQQRLAPPSRSLTSITISGLSDSMRDELRSKLPVHEGETLSADSYGKIVTAVRDFDEHLIVNSTILNDSMSLRISTPNAPREGAVAMNTTGPKLVRQPRPVYPPLAKQAGVSGVVTFSAVIGADGGVKKLEVISGHPLLIPAALEAVKQWAYEPTLLNGNPVDVATTITVNFTLSQ